MKTLDKFSALRRQEIDEMEKNVFVDVSGRHVNMKLSFVGGDGEVQMREAASLTSRSAARCPTCVAIFREGMAPIPLLEMVGDRRPATDALLGNRELVFPIPVLHNLLHALEHSFCVLVKFAKVYAAPRQQMEAASKGSAFLFPRFHVSNKFSTFI